MCQIDRTCHLEFLTIRIVDLTSHINHLPMPMQWRASSKQVGGNITDGDCKNSSGDKSRKYDLYKFYYE